MDIFTIKKSLKINLLTRARTFASSSKFNKKRKKGKELQWLSYESAENFQISIK